MHDASHSLDRTFEFDIGPIGTISRTPSVSSMQLDSSLAAAILASRAPGKDDSEQFSQSSSSYAPFAQEITVSHFSSAPYSRPSEPATPTKRDTAADIFYDTDVRGPSKRNKKPVAKTAPASLQRELKLDRPPGLDDDVDPELEMAMPTTTTAPLLPPTFTFLASEVAVPPVLIERITQLGQSQIQQQTALIHQGNINATFSERLLR